MILVTNMALIAGLVGVAIACQWFAWWVKLPAILFLLLVGTFVGPMMGWFHPDILFGHWLLPTVSLSVAIILFEGSLSLRWHEVKEHGYVVRNLVTIGIVFTAALTALCAHWLLAMDWSVAALLGAISAVSGPTVIIPMLRTVRPNSRLTSIIRWEAMLIDPIGALLAVLVFSAIVAIDQYELWGSILWHFFGTIGIGAAIGIIGGYILGIAIRRHWLPDYLNSTFALAMVLILYVASEACVEGAGLITVTLMGIVVSNMPGTNIEDVLDFKEHLSILLISTLFIILAARTDFTFLDHVWLPTAILFLLLQFVVRPLSVMLCTLKSRLSWREKILLAWIAPRGIVAAAVAAIFSLRLQQNGMPNANELVLVTFLLIMSTVIFQSATARYVAKLLKVASPDPRGFLIIGANPVARLIGKALQEQGFDVILSDTTWSDVHQARMAGLRCYYGNPVSEHADRQLDLVGIGRLLGLAPTPEVNSLACVRYQREFGRSQVFSLPTPASSEKHDIAHRHDGLTLFADTAHYQQLLDYVKAGARIKSTRITESFNLDSYIHTQKGEVLPLFAISPKGRLHVVHTEEPVVLASDWRLMSLVVAD
jgi:NhaP-type Na+/H+ or K+/H+ antiporter